MTWDPEPFPGPWSMSLKKPDLRSAHPTDKLGGRRKPVNCNQIAGWAERSERFSELPSDLRSAHHTDKLGGSRSNCNQIVGWAERSERFSELPSDLRSAHHTDKLRIKGFS